MPCLTPRLASASPASRHHAEPSALIGRLQWVPVGGPLLVAATQEIESVCSAPRRRAAAQLLHHPQALSTLAVPSAALLPCCQHANCMLMCSKRQAHAFPALLPLPRLVPLLTLSAPCTTGTPYLFFTLSTQSTVQRISHVLQQTRRACTPPSSRGTQDACVSPGTHTGAPPHTPTPSSTEQPC